MPLQTSGLITLSNIKVEFSKNFPIWMSSLYNVTTGIPSSGLITLSNFYGKSAQVLYSSGQIYPPAAMTANTTTFSGLSYGNGIYTVSGYLPIYTTNDYFYAFDTNKATNSAPNAGFNNNAWLGVSTTFTGAGTYAGPWIRINLPYAIKVASINITPQATTNGPQNINLLGSNDGINWTVLMTNNTPLNYTGNTNAMNTMNITVTTTNTYSSYVFIWTSITSTTGSYLARLAEFSLVT